MWYGKTTWWEILAKLKDINLINNKAHLTNEGLTKFKN